MKFNESIGSMFTYEPLPTLYNFNESEDTKLINAIAEAFKVAGWRGEDVFMGIHKVLKRIDRTDLLPPCAH